MTPKHVQYVNLEILLIVFFTSEESYIGSHSVESECIRGKSLGSFFEEKVV